jgi:hypothetical protein
MKKITITLMLLTTTILCACGGGGGGSTTAAPAQPTTATIKISTQGTYPSGALIGGINVTLALPAGVTVKATPDTINPSILVTNSGVVAASGVAVSNSTILATYSAATSSVAGTVHIQIANPTGFVIGEFVTVKADIAAGSNPTAAGFSLPSFAAVDLNGTALGALTAASAATIQ